MAKKRVKKTRYCIVQRKSKGVLSTVKCFTKKTTATRRLSALRKSCTKRNSSRYKWGVPKACVGLSVVKRVRARF